MNIYEERARTHGRERRGEQNGQQTPKGANLVFLVEFRWYDTGREVCQQIGIMYGGNEISALERAYV